MFGVRARERGAGNASETRTDSERMEALGNGHPVRLCPLSCDLDPRKGFFPFRQKLEYLMDCYSVAGRRSIPGHHAIDVSRCRDTALICRGT